MGDFAAMLVAGAQPTITASTKQDVENTCNPCGRRSRYRMPGCFNSIVPQVLPGRACE
jgi:hypothetical protein